MIPTTWLAILSFFLFVAPGVLYDLESARRRVGVRESTFREVSRVALASTVISSLALLIVEAVGAWWAPGVFPPPDDIVRGGQRYLVEDIGGASRTAALFFVVALTLAYAASLAIHRRTPGRIKYTSMWHAAFRLDRPARGEPHVRAQLSDGSVWYGRVKYFSPDHEVADRDLMLSPPIAVAHASGDSDDEGGSESASGTARPKELNRVWQRVILKGTEIQAMAVKYVDSETSPPSSRWDRSVEAVSARLTQVKLAGGVSISAIVCAIALVSLYLTGQGEWLVVAIVALASLVVASLLAVFLHNVARD